MDSNQSNFHQFSDQLRLQNSNLANLSLNDSIWSSSYTPKRAGDRRNFDIRVGGEVNNSVNNSSGEFDYSLWNKIANTNSSNVSINSFNSGYGSVPISPASGINGGFNKGIYSTPPPTPMNNFNYVKGINNNMNVSNNNVVGNGKGLYFGKNNSEEFGTMMQMGKGAKKNGKVRRENAKENNNGESKNAVDKRFKTLPPAEALPRNETIGGYIFVCNNDTMQENLKRQLFGLPPRYRDSVRAITPGLPLFLYNYSTHQLHGIFEAASFGGTNIDPSAWEDKKNHGESRFPAQVRVVTRKICEPLEEDSFRPILHHYDGPKFRLELNVPEALSLLDVFDEIDTSNKTLENIVNRAISTTI